MEPVSFPRFWIAGKMVTERDFAVVMGREIRKERNPDQPVTDIEWSEALAYCERFTAKYAAQLPKNTIVSIPTLFEWALTAYGGSPSTGNPQPPLSAHCVGGG